MSPPKCHSQAVANQHTLKIDLGFACQLSFLILDDDVVCEERCISPSVTFSRDEEVSAENARD